MNKSKNTDVHILKIHHPEGSAGVYTHEDPAITHYVGENEFIMPRNSVIKVHPTPETYEDDNHTVHVWTAHRQSLHGPTGKDTHPDDGRTELFNNGNVKLYKTDTLGAYKKHYKDFFDQDNGTMFHNNHVNQPVLHLHTSNGMTWQSSLEGTEMVFRPAKGHLKATSTQVLEKYPELNSVKDNFIRKDVVDYSKRNSNDQ